MSSHSVQSMFLVHEDIYFAILVTQNKRTRKLDGLTIFNNAKLYWILKLKPPWDCEILWHF